MSNALHELLTAIFAQLTAMERISGFNLDYLRLQDGAFKLYYFIYHDFKSVPVAYPLDCLTLAKEVAEYCHYADEEFSGEVMSGFLFPNDLTRLKSAWERRNIIDEFLADNP